MKTISLLVYIIIVLLPLESRAQQNAYYIIRMKNAFDVITEGVYEDNSPFHITINAKYTESLPAVKKQYPSRAFDIIKVNADSSITVQLVSNKEIANKYGTKTYSIDTSFVLDNSNIDKQIVLIGVKNIEKYKNPVKAHISIYKFLELPKALQKNIQKRIKADNEVDYTITIKN